MGIFNLLLFGLLMRAEEKIMYGVCKTLVLASVPRPVFHDVTWMPVFHCTKVWSLWNCMDVWWLLIAFIGSIRILAGITEQHVKESTTLKKSVEPSSCSKTTLVMLFPQL
ncbi:hypothetical protein Pelo_19639 [Pelomyxa schiedti]|nr:hypothetical protein Pelo_19639 [Pelomyxa schiedti]